MKVEFLDDKKKAVVTYKKAYSILIHMKEAVRRHLEENVKMGILRKLKPGEDRHYWLSPMLIIPKKNGEPRRVVDFKRLNSQCRRAINSSQDTMRMAMSVLIARSKREKIYFSCLDAWNGYHSIPLEKTAEQYFGFLTEFGRYAYKVAPQGFLGSGDHYVGVYDDIMRKLQ